MMRFIGKLWRRLCYLARRRQLERELAEEMDAHREMMTADRRPHFGSATRLHEESREAWSWRWLDEALQDLSYGARVLARAPGFTLGAITVLALGIGVNLAEFQIFDALFFHRFSVAGADSILGFQRVARKGRELGFPAAAVEFYRRESKSFEWLISEDPSFETTLDGDSGLRSNFVSANYFGALGVIPAWGRLFDTRDSQPGAPPVVVLGYDYWMSRWAGDPRAIGRVVHINNRLVAIVGVLPYTFDGLWKHSTAVWLPEAIRPQLMAGSPPPRQDYSRASDMIFGKMKPGVSPAAGAAELTSLTRELSRRAPLHFRAGELIQGVPLEQSLREGVKRSPAIAIFITMVLLVLLSACANLGNILLARGLARQREIEIRLSIGASRGRLIRQFMTENLLLALLGAAAGLVFGATAARLLLNALDAPSSFVLIMGQLTTSLPVIAAAVALSLISAVAFGLPAAIRITRTGAGKIRARQSLVAIQVAVSCLLLIASGVLAHNGIRSASIGLAFDYKDMVVVYPRFYTHELPLPVVQQKMDALVARLSALPGVDGVTEAVAPPLGGRRIMDTLPGLPRIYRNAVAPSYFGAMGLPLVRGRTFFAGERNAAIVSETAARAVWPNEDPIGKTWNFADADRTVVGVVKDSGANLFADPDSIEAYVPIEGAALDKCAVILHARGDAAKVVRMAPGVAADMCEIVSVAPMAALRDSFLENHRKLLTLFGSIGAVATVLAAAGMFALIAFAVAQRRREIGIRIAIGARTRHVLVALLGQNLKPIAAGAIAGAILAAVLTRVARSLIVLQDQEMVDAVGFAAGVGGFLLIAALATLAPAMRALRIDAASTLREE